jgi:hypothetical protein
VAEEGDKKAAINVVLAHEKAVQEYDLDKVEFSAYTARASVIPARFLPLLASSRITSRITAV